MAKEMAILLESKTMLGSTMLKVYWFRKLEHIVDVIQYKRTSKKKKERKKKM